VAGQQPERIVGNAGSRSKENDRNGLVGDLIVAGIQVAAAGSDKAQAAVFNFKPPTFKPDQAMAVGVGNARLFKAEAAG
jgi:hypothetical protein